MKTLGRLDTRAILSHLTRLDAISFFMEQHFPATGSAMIQQREAVEAIRAKLLSVALADVEVETVRAECVGEDRS